MEDDITKKLNQMVGNLFGKMQYEATPAIRKFPKGLRYRYYSSFDFWGRKVMFCWSTTRNVNDKFLSWVYLPKGTKKRRHWDFTRMRELRSRAGSKRRAARLHEAYEKGMKVREEAKAAPKQEVNHD